MGRQGTAQITYAYKHTPSSHWTLFRKQKFKGKIINNFEDSDSLEAWISSERGALYPLWLLCLGTEHHLTWVVQATNRRAIAASSDCPPYTRPKKSIPFFLPYYLYFWDTITFSSPSSTLILCLFSLSVGASDFSKIKI